MNPQALLDWRNVQVKRGDTVIFYSKFIGLVEAQIEELHSSGMVSVRLVRSRNPKWFPVGTWQVAAEAVTVVDRLPKTTLPTVTEIRDARKREEAEARRAFEVKRADGQSE